MPEYVIHEPQNDMIWPGAIRANSADAALAEVLEHVRDHPWVYQIEGAASPFEILFRAVNLEDETDYADGIGQLLATGEEADTTEESLTSCISATLRIAAGAPATEAVHPLHQDDADWVYAAISRHLGRSIHGERRTRIQLAAQAFIDEVRALGAPVHDNGTSDHK